MKTGTKFGFMWWIAAILGLLGIIGHIVTLPLISAYSFALLVVGFVLYLVMPVLDDVMHA